MHAFDTLCILKGKKKAKFILNYLNALGTVFHDLSPVPS